MTIIIPLSWKIYATGNGKLIEKYILREAFKDLLPEPIYRRKKLRFAAGTGTDDLMDDVAKTIVDDGDFNRASNLTSEGYTLNSPKEHWYYDLFKKRFPDPCFEKLVGRWDPNK